MRKPCCCCVLIKSCTSRVNTERNELSREQNDIHVCKSRLAKNERDSEADKCSRTLVSAIKVNEGNKKRIYINYRAARLQPTSLSESAAFNANKLAASGCLRGCFI